MKKANLYIKCSLIIIVTLLLCCARVPPEFISAMESENIGINMLKDRHVQTVNELVDLWYGQHLSKLSFIKEQELRKITVPFPNPEGGPPLIVVEIESLLKIEEQYDESLVLANSIRVRLIEGYLDSDNWEKLRKIHLANMDMAKSLLELNEAQRKFYSNLVSSNLPYPIDFINEKTKNMLDKYNLIK